MKQSLGQSKPALLEASRTIQGILKTLPGFVEGFVYEKRSDGEPYTIVMTAVSQPYEHRHARIDVQATRI
jgi:hypothetical protein